MSSTCTQFILMPSNVHQAEFEVFLTHTLGLLHGRGPPRPRVWHPLPLVGLCRHSMHLSNLIAIPVRGSHHHHGLVGGSRRHRSTIEITSWIWPIHSGQGLPPMIRNGCRSIRPHFSATCVPSDSHGPTTCAPICGPIPMRDPLFVRSAAKRLRDSMIENGTKDYTQERRSSSVVAISHEAGIGVVVAVSPVPMHWAAISDQRPAGSASNPYWMKNLKSASAYSSTTNNTKTTYSPSRRR